MCILFISEVKILVLTNRSYMCPNLEWLAYFERIVHT